VRPRERRRVPVARPLRGDRRRAPLVDRHGHAAALHRPGLARVAPGRALLRDAPLRGGPGSAWRRGRGPAVARPAGGAGPRRLATLAPSWRL
ncbi:MAG: hypothetical protein AVDCRST_MAG49-3761, partial [uncultured Thermomicrobiales bacterium]